MFILFCTANAAVADWSIMRVGDTLLKHTIHEIKLTIVNYDTCDELYDTMTHLDSLFPAT